VVLLGSSGVGKSTIVNHLMGETVLTVREIREADGRGRHTTTHRQLLVLPGGEILVDTPGLREVGLWSGEEGLERTFPDVEEIAARCRFRDCGHRSEPGCAVQAAMLDGTLESGRFESYRKLQRELAHLARRQDQRARIQEAQRWKKISLEMRQRYKIEGRGR
jgi:ribosome biogenesis GTPase